MQLRSTARFIYLYVYTCSYQHCDVLMHRHASMFWCIDAYMRRRWMPDTTNAMWKHPSNWRPRALERSSRGHIPEATSDLLNVRRRLAATSNESTLGAYYTYIRIFIHIHIHIYIHVHMSAQVSLLVMRIHRLTMVTPWLYETSAQLYWLYLCRCTPWRARQRSAIGKWRRLVCIPQSQAAVFYNLLLLPTRRIRVCRQRLWISMEKSRRAFRECGRSLNKNKAVH